MRLQKYTGSFWESRAGGLIKSISGEKNELLFWAYKLVLFGFCLPPEQILFYGQTLLACFLVHSVSSKIIPKSKISQRELGQKAQWYPAGHHNCPNIVDLQASGCLDRSRQQTGVLICEIRLTVVIARQQE